MTNIINELLLTEVKTIIGDGSALLLIDPVGMKAEDSLKLRSDLYQIGAVMKVCKASLVRQALPAGTEQVLGDGGSVGIVASEDLPAAAKVINAFAKQEKVAMRGGLMEGGALDAARALALADLPSKDQLRGMLVRVLAAPLQGLAQVLNEVPTSLARVINAAKDRQSAS